MEGYEPAFLRSIEQALPPISKIVIPAFTFCENFQDRKEMLQFYRRFFDATFHFPE